MALHALHAMWSSYEKAACLSVRPSVCQTRDLWQNKRKLCPHSNTTWKIIYPSFMTRRMFWWGTTPSTWNFWVKLTLERKCRFSFDIRS